MMLKGHVWWEKKENEGLFIVPFHIYIAIFISVLPNLTASTFGQVLMHHVEIIGSVKIFELFQERNNPTVTEEQSPSHKHQNSEYPLARHFNVCLQKIQYSYRTQKVHYIIKSLLTRLHFHLRQGTQASFFSFISFRKWPRKINDILSTYILYTTLKFVSDLYKTSQNTFPSVMTKISCCTSS